MTYSTLIEFADVMNTRIKRAEKMIKMLPKRDWDVQIDSYGDVLLDTTDIAGSREALLKAGFNCHGDSTFFFKNNNMVTLRQL